MHFLEQYLQHFSLELLLVGMIEIRKYTKQKRKVQELGMYLANSLMLRA